MKAFKLCFVVNEDQLPTMVSLLAGECTNFQVTQMDEEVNQQSAPKAKRFRRSPAREQRLGMIVLDLMDDGMVRSSSEIARKIAKAGYAEKSATAILSTLCTQGDLTRIGRRMFQLPGHNPEGNMAEETMKEFFTEGA